MEAEEVYGDAKGALLVEAGADAVRVRPRDLSRDLQIFLRMSNL